MGKYATFLSEQEEKESKIVSAIKTLAADNKLQVDWDGVKEELTILIPAGFVTLGEDELGNPKYFFADEKFGKKLAKEVGDEWEYSISDSMASILIKKKVKSEIKTVAEAVDTKKLRWVYGTKTNKWYLVDQSDRDYDSGIEQKEFEKIGKETAKKKYLQSEIIKQKTKPEIKTVAEAVELTDPISRYKVMKEVNDRITFLNDELKTAFEQQIREHSRFDNLENITFLEHNIVRALRTIPEIKSRLDDLQVSLKRKIEYLKKKEKQ